MAEAFRNLRQPQVARDRENGRCVITLNGAEDKFYVLQMDDDAAEALAVTLQRAGYGREADH
ncbi:hypothetical protein AC629_42275 [Bradyrhizobium sp. NAS80.1]|uniref:hypothetical protein n=1 Tax=Bradyrhizobium sp. NAS80.1 TaxID=1680159 RepID=UPI0009633A43|nr:hypothetical protein [Bradyrhizobium sp. NAS80.1]OKO68200.1 hypothetical protein AC629_42275 [Bradyrhizobium sp. NAS80.1]